MDVRRLRSGDLDLASSAARALGGDLVGLAPDGAVLRGFLSRESNVLLVAFSGRAPVGVLVAYVLDRLDGARPMVCLYEIGVVEKRRREGIGTALVEALLDISAALGAAKTWTVTHRSNEAAMRLFREAGGVAEAAEGDADQVFTWRRLG